MSGLDARLNDDTPLRNFSQNPPNKIMSQANTKEGDVMIFAGENLTGCEDMLAAPFDLDGQLAVRRPMVGDRPIYLILYGCRYGSFVTCRPLNPERSVRIVARGAGRPADPLVIADFDSKLHSGKVRAAGPEDEGRAIVGLAEEAFVDGQTVKMRPTFGIL